MLVQDFMTDNVITCQLDQTVAEAADIMYENGFSVIPIVDEKDVLVGIVTESDFVGKEVQVPHALASIKELFGQMFYFREVEAIFAVAKKKKLSEIMSKKPFCVTPATSLTDVINVMISRKVKKLPVLDNQKIVGIITRKDILRAFKQIPS